MLFIYVSIQSSKLSAQNNCKENLIYKTYSLGNGKEALPFDLNFSITMDTLRITDDENKVKSHFTLQFLIIEKRCKWNSDYTQGISVYKLLSFNKEETKHPTLTVEIDKDKSKITLQYEKSDPRVFKISSLKNHESEP